MCCRGGGKPVEAGGVMKWMEKVCEGVGDEEMRSDVVAWYMWW